MDFLERLKYARQAELLVQAELEHIERLHRIMRLPNRSDEYLRGLLDKLRELEKRLNSDIDHAVDRKNEALNILDKLDGDERMVLYQYYILGKGWDAIAEEVHYSIRWVYNTREKAVKRLSAIYGEQGSAKKNRCFAREEKIRKEWN